MRHDLERLSEAFRSFAGVGQLIVVALELERALSTEGLAQDLDIFTGSGEWLA